jgi:hypothetical protein
MKKLIAFVSNNGKHCIASVSINSFKEFFLDYIWIENISTNQELSKRLYTSLLIRTEKRESLLLSIVDKYCSSSLNEIFEIKN